jgi:hypothetical protein
MLKETTMSQSLRYSVPKIIRRFKDGESALEIAASLGMARDRVLRMVQHAALEVCPEAGLTASGPMTEPKVAKILRGD